MQTPVSESMGGEESETMHWDNSSEKYYKEEEKWAISGKGCGSRGDCFVSMGEQKTCLYSARKEPEMEKLIIWRDLVSCLVDVGSCVQSRSSPKMVRMVYL